MTTNGLLQIGLYLVVLLALARPLGAYMARVYEGRPSGLDRVLGPLERLIYRSTGVRPDQEMDWKVYALSMLLFSVAGWLFLYALQRLQGFLPWNPASLGAVTPDSSFNTATSFVTNTNWQGYGGETTMSYLTQMLGLTVQNFVSAATGMAVLVAFIRGLARRNAKTIGNFWVDLTRVDPLHPAAAVAGPGARPGVAGCGADLLRVPDGHARSKRLPTPTASRSPSRCSRWDRRPRRSPSSSSAPTAAASSTSTPPIRSRTRRRSRTSSRCSRSC